MPKGITDKRGKILSFISFSFCAKKPPLYIFKFLPFDSIHLLSATAIDEWDNRGIL